MLRFLLTAGLMAGVVSAQTYRPDFDPSRLKGPTRATPNEVMVLGTPHLGELPPAFRNGDVAPLVERLATWRPAAIAIEKLSGVQCDQLRRFPARYRDTVDAYCWDTAPARAATGLDVPAATAEADRLLSAWPAVPTAAQRRRLAAVFLAGGERVSALVQWLRLPVAEQRAGDGLDAGLVTLLEQQRVARNEVTLIAAPLAARLGLERVVAMDDHSADASSGDDAGYAAAITRAWDNPATTRRGAAFDTLKAKLGTTDGLLALYRAFNGRGYARLAFDSDFGAAMNEPSPQGFGRGYLTYWETRNLRMAANIRASFSARGGRTLVIVGASHKGYLEAYLNQMHDVRLVGTGAVLR